MRRSDATPPNGDDSWHGRRKALTDELQVLLVEDSTADAELVTGLLRRGLSDPFGLQRVATLNEAITVLALQRFDVILLDLTLPDSTGLSTFERVRECSNGDTLFVLSGVEDTAIAIETVRCGAEHYFLKGNLEASALGREVRFAIERNRRRAAERRLDAAESELQLARQLQRSLYPAKAPPVRGFDIAGRAWSASQACGDYYDYLPMGNGTLGIAVGDVSGHGLPAALKMVEARACLHCLAGDEDELPELIAGIHRVFCWDSPWEPDSEPEHLMFLTLFLARLDPGAGTLTWCGAGHAAHLLRRSGDVETLPSAGFPIGLHRCTADASSQTKLESGDIVLIPTDGFQEAGARAGDGFGISRMLDVVCQMRNRPSAEILTAIYDAARSHCRGMDLEDDMSGVVIRVE